MKKTAAILSMLLTLSLPLPAQENVPVIPVSRQINFFSPLAHIYLNNLGLTDTNNNGVIDRGAGEGYEEFIAKYGNADTGFHANYILCGEADGKLEEPEIINWSITLAMIIFPQLIFNEKSLSFQFSFQFFFRGEIEHIF